MKSQTPPFLIQFLFLILFSSSLVAQVPSYVPTNGLVGYWPFNGNANDESGNGNHGTVNGATLTSDRVGNSNAAFLFSGLNCCGTPDAESEITISSPFISLNANFTISCWMRSSDVTKYQQCLFNSINHTGFGVELNNEHVPGRLTSGIGPADAFWDLLYSQGSYTNYQSNTWYFVTFVKSGTSYTTYLNGNLDCTVSVPNAVNYNQIVGIRFGSIGGGHENFKGTIDDISIHNRALSLVEIIALYNGVPSQVIAGCTNTTACNYNATATQDDGSCTYPAQNYLTCAGTCINDADNDGTCDELESPTLPSYLPSNGLVGYWPFNGNANDESGNGNHGTVNGATLAEDRFGNAESCYRSIASINSSIIGNCSSFPSGNQPRTISIWYNALNLGEYQAYGLFGYGGESCGQSFNINFDNFDLPIGNYEIQGHCANFRQIVPYPTPPNLSWYNISITYDGSTFKFYNNSILAYSSDPVAINTVTTNKIFNLIGEVNESGNAPYITGYYPNGWKSFDGLVDDIAIYNRALTQEEITALYNGTTNGGGGGNGGTAGPPAPSVPQGIPYQAMIRDNNGAALMNTPVIVRFSLRQDATDGTVEYQETHNLTTNAFGLVNTHFGSGTATQGTFANINWSNTTKFIQIEANTGSGFVEMGTQQMMSVPFALKANSANEANKVKNAGLPVYANNAAALAGGLLAGDMYRTAAGILMIVY